MIDYSFIRLKETLEEALNIGDPTVSNIFDFGFIQLLPNKSYTQITSAENGISLDSDCRVYVAGCNGENLVEITNNVFISEFIDSNGNNQCTIEYVNLGVDFYGKQVMFKFVQNTSNAVFYSNLLNITDYGSKQTVFLQYKNYDDYFNIGYTNANVYQSISVRAYFDITINESEVEDYYQISTNNTISARASVKHFEQYQIEKINDFGLRRLDILFKHDIIYLDGIRITNKPIISSEERLGETNYYPTTVTVGKDYKDKLDYTYQVFSGLELFNFNPYGNYITGVSFDSFGFEANLPLTLNTGVISVYDSLGVLIYSVTETDMVINLETTLKFSVIGTPLQNLANGTYYVHVSEGLVSGLGDLNEEINNTTTWMFTLQNADFLGTDFNNTDFFTD